MTVNYEQKLDLLFFLGRPLSPLYSCIMALRSKFYQKGIFKQNKLEVPVISVGNLVLGGTGKTPLVHYIARFLQEQNRQPAILCRGYKGTATAPINVVSTPRDILMDAFAAGDEPRLLAEKMVGVPVITGKKRFRTGRFAIDSFGSDVLILDDGFQHMALKRDINLVLFSALKCLGNRRVLPGGELREPLAALQRADAFIISNTGVPLDGKTAKFTRLLESLYPEKPIYTGTYQASKKLARFFKGKNDDIPLADAPAIPLYGFCGIAGPEAFQKTLKKNGILLTGFKSYGDHHLYTAADLQLILADAVHSGAAGLITTEKDLVKLRRIYSGDLPLLALSVEFCLGEDFDRFLLSRLAKY